MQHKLPALGRFKVFESAARHLSFTKAADEQCITKSAVGYQIQKLEQFLTYPLFKRSVRQVFLTEAGQKLYQLIKTVFTNLDVGLERLKTTSSNELVIGATTYVAARWLAPRVAKFL